MTQYIISGRTFEQRDAFKALGGEWNGNERYWTLPGHTSQAVIDRLKSTPGVNVIERGGSSKPSWLPEAPGPIITGWDIGTEDAPVRPAFTNNGRTTIIGNDQTYFNAFRSKNPLVFAGFKSLGDFADWLETLPDDHQYGERGAGWSRGQTDWVGTPDMSTALRRARLGWQDGAEKAKDALAVLQGDNPLQRRRKATIAGGRVNVGRMLSGSPVHMVQRTRQPGSKVVTLFVETSLSASITAENIIIFAALVAAISDVLEDHDYVCEIVALDTTNGLSGRPACQAAIVLKQAGETLNLSDVVFGLGHPSFQRRMIFGLCSIDELRSIWGSFGSPDVAFDRQYRPEPGSFYLPTLDSRRQNLMKGTFEQKCRALFPLIVPKGFPVELSN